MITLQPVNMVQAATDLLWSRVVRDFPVKFALSEGGIGWIPYLMERADYVYRHHRTWTGTDLGDKLPSDLFREKFVACFIDDHVGIRLRDQIGVDLICWEADYPHSDSTWPDSPRRLAASLADVPDDEVAAITHGNALREFRFDPFAHRPPEQCTVGALRAQAGEVDTSIRPSGKAVDPPEGEVTLVSLLDKAAKILEAASGQR
jgi:hypothetical protein